MGRLGKLKSYDFWRSGFGGRIPAVIDAVKKLDEAATFYNTSRRHVGRRAWGLSRSGFSLKEMCLWGLLDPALSQAELWDYVSKKSMMRFQAAMSPRDHRSLLEDKEVFYRYACALGIPTPEPIAFVSTEVVRSGISGRTLSARELENRIAELEGMEVVLKPAYGVYGGGFREFVVSGGRLSEGGIRMSVDGLLATLEQKVRYILQARLNNHPALDQLTGVRALQTVRVITALPRYASTRGRVLSMNWRLVPPSARTDNFNFGYGGSMLTRIDPTSGIVMHVAKAGSNGFGLEDVLEHPVTGREVVGEALPLWRELVELMETISPMFYPIRFVGWDVAITQAGPVILEGNFFFDPDNLNKPFRRVAGRRAEPRLVWDTPANS